MTTAWRRIVFDLSHGSGDAEALATVADFARLLGLELHCLFIEDEALVTLADLPFAREYRLATNAWSPLDAARLAADFEDSASRLRQALQAAIGGAGVRSAFQVLRGDPATCLLALRRNDDILVLAESGAPLGRAAYGFARLRHAAQYSGGAVLLLPSRSARREGPVAVLAEGAEDAAVEIACRIALAADEGVLVLLHQPGGEVQWRAAAAALRDQAEAIGLPRDRVTVRRLHGVRTDDLLHALGTQRERLIVLRRAPGNGAGRLVAGRGVPLLLTGAG